MPSTFLHGTFLLIVSRYLNEVFILFRPFAQNLDENRQLNPFSRYVDHFPGTSLVKILFLHDISNAMHHYSLSIKTRIYAHKRNCRLDTPKSRQQQNVPLQIKQMVRELIIEIHKHETNFKLRRNLAWNKALRSSSCAVKRCILPSQILINTTPSAVVRLVTLQPLHYRF